MLQFLRDVWICNPHLKKREEAFDLGVRLLKMHIKNKAQRKRFFSGYIRELREKVALLRLEKLGTTLSNNSTVLDHPVSACSEIKLVLYDLGLTTKGSDRDCFCRLQNWYFQLRPSEQDKIDKFDWLENLQLQE